MSRDSERAASNLVCFMLGAAVGAAVALLYAPQTGTETRRQLGEKAQDAKEKAEAVAYSAKERAEAAAQTAKERIAVVSEKVQELRRPASSTGEPVLAVETEGGDEDYAV